MEDDCDTSFDYSTLTTSILLAGSFFSVIALVNNTILLLSLLRSPHCFNSYFQYLLLLSFFDILVSLCYVPVIVVDNAKDRFKSLPLARFWWSSFSYLLALTHVAMSASCFVLMFVSLERYFITIRSGYLDWVKRQRGWICVFAVIAALLLKGPIVFELRLRRHENCTDTVAEYIVELSQICSSTWYSVVYRFTIRNVVTVFVPFVFIVYINLLIVNALKSQVQHDKLHSDRRFIVNTKQKHGVRSATRAMTMVCVTYVLSNALNVFITSWEFIDLNSLISEHFSLYMTCTDIVSMLSILACALRLPIYMLCNKELRQLVGLCFFSPYRITRTEVLIKPAMQTGAMIHLLIAPHKGTNDASHPSNPQRVSLESTSIPKLQLNSQ